MQYNSERKQEWYYDERHDVFVNVYNGDDHLSPQKFISRLNQVIFNKIKCAEIDENTLFSLEAVGVIYEIAVPTNCNEIIKLLGGVNNPLNYVNYFWFKSGKKLVIRSLEFVTAITLISGVFAKAISVESAGQEREDAIYFHELIQYQMNTHDYSLDKAIWAVMDSLVGSEELKKMSPEKQAEIYRLYENSYYFCEDNVIGDQNENIKK